MNFRRLLTVVALVFFTLSCGSKSRVVTTKKEQEKLGKDVRVVYVEKQEEPKTETAVSIKKAPARTSYANEIVTYIERYRDIAKKEMKAHGIPASITLAQGILESAAGTSEIAVRAKNHFGIKCTNDWQGQKFYRDDQCFRRYNSAEASFKDHSLFLKRPHYQSLYSLAKDDYGSWARGLQRAGYATDSRYHQKLIDIIERYQLHKYDKEVLKTLKQQSATVKATSGFGSSSSGASTSYASTVTKYIDLYKGIAKKEMKEHGIPASITLAQAILESGAGASELAVRAKNHFGIKCTREWGGQTFYRDNDCFRKYANPEASFKDHSLFLKRPHYQSLYSLAKDDYKSWARGLKDAGYATDSRYPEKLTGIIERYQLYKYDKEVLKTLSQQSATISAGSGASASGVTSDYVTKYVNLYKEVAKYEMKEHGIPASIILAQAILESGAGGSELAVRAKNHFGIKCNNDWQGQTFYRDGQCFRKYNNARLSFKDHSLFLQQPRYRSLFSLSKSNYKAWAAGLKDAGYATDDNYPQKIIDLIEKYKLYIHDREVLGTTSKPKASVAVKSSKPNKIERYKVKRGDTLYSIAKKYGVSVEAIMISNGLKNTNIAAGQVLSIQKPN